MIRLKFKKLIKLKPHINDNELTDSILFGNESSSKLSPAAYEMGPNIAPSIKVKNLFFSKY